MGFGITVLGFVNNYSGGYYLLWPAENSELLLSGAESLPLTNCISDIAVDINQNILKRSTRGFGVLGFWGFGVSSIKQKVLIITEKVRVRESSCRCYEGQIVNKIEHFETSHTA